MPVSAKKTRLYITIKKESLDLFTKFSEALGMTKSEFMEDICLSFIQDVVKKQQERRKSQQKGKA